MRARPLVALLVALLAVPVSGCLEPYRVHVDPAAVARSSLEWEVTVGRLSKDGWLGQRTIETRYLHHPDSGPPFPAELYVFSLRKLDRSSTRELREQAEAIVEAAAQEHKVELDPETQRGERLLRSGARSTWFLREGTVEQGGTPFGRSATVRLLGEVGHDGKSSTSFVAIALVQVAEFDSTPIFGGHREDLRAWIEVAGDPQGNVAGAVGQNGFLHHLKTHG